MSLAEGEQPSKLYFLNLLHPNAGIMDEIVTPISISISTKDTVVTN
jgi:hypothetical protein